MRPPYRAVLFDMDGLLVDTEPMWFAAETEVAARLGVTWTPEHQHAMLGGSLPRLAGRLLELSGASGVRREQVEQQLLDAMEQRLRRQGAALRPGAGGLLHRLGSDGTRLGLVSSSYRVLVDAALAHLGAERFEVTIAGDEVTHRKPHPEPYLRAAELVGLAPGECLVLEDSPPGVASARAAGCPVVAVPSLVPVDPAPGVHVLPSLECLDDESLPAAAEAARNVPSRGTPGVASRATPGVD